MKRFFKDHLIPHAGNDYAPHVLQKTAMAGMAGLVLLSFAAANLQALLWLNVDWLVSAVLPAVVVDETNDERADGAIAPLARNSVLDRAAQLKAEHMAEEGYFAHYAPDGTSPWHWFRATNYSYVHAGENLAVHFNDSREVVRAWMDSPTHRANIMNGRFTEIGIGVAEGEFDGYNTVFVVQMFGTPAVPEPAAPANTVTVVSEQVNEPVTNDAPQVAAAEESVSSESLPTQPAAEPQPVATAPEPTPEPVEPIREPEPAPEQWSEMASATPTTTDEIAAALTVNTPTSTNNPVPEAEQFITTSTNAVPATTEAQSPTAGSTSLFGVLATSPQTVLQTLYVALGLFVVVVLMLSIGIETRRHNPLQIAYSFGLLAIMGGLYYLQAVVTTGATII